MKLSVKTTMSSDVALLCNGVEVCEQAEWSDFLSKDFIDDLEKAMSGSLINPDFDSQRDAIVADAFLRNNRWQLRIPVYNVETVSTETGFLCVAREKCGIWHFRLSYNKSILEGSTDETYGLSVIRGICMSVMDADDYMNLSREFFENEENYFSWN